MKNFIVKNYKYFLAGIIIGLVALGFDLDGKPAKHGLLHRLLFERHRGQHGYALGGNRTVFPS